MSMDSCSPALLIVDVQRGFINSHTAHIPSLVERLQHEYQTVFATQFSNPEGSNFRRLIHWQRFTPGSTDIELAFVADPKTQVIHKSIYSCVTDRFLSDLRREKITEIHVCGIDTDICVTKCAVDLFESGLTPFVLEKYSASHAGEAAHAGAINVLKRFIGKGQII